MEGKCLHRPRAGIQNNLAAMAALATNAVETSVLWKDTVEGALRCMTQDPGLEPNAQAHGNAHCKVRTGRDMRSTQSLSGQEGELHAKIRNCMPSEDSSSSEQKVSELCLPPLREGPRSCRR